MLLIIDSAEKLTQALSIARFGTMSLQLSLLLGMVLMLVMGWGMFKRDERLVHWARSGQYVLMLMLILAGAALYTMIFNGLYVSNYVYRTVENQEELFFKITALWASQEGSLLFWSIILGLVCTTFAFTNRHTRTDRRLPATMLVMFLVQVFFLTLLMYDRSNPFALSIDWMVHPWFEGLSGQGFAEFLGNLQDAQAHLEKGVAYVALPKESQAFIGNLVAKGHLASTDIAPTKLAEELGDLFSGMAPWYRELINTLTGFSKEGIEVAQPMSLTLGQIHERLISDATQLDPALQQVLVNAMSEGQGMNPQLHNYWIAIHPPTLYLGYIGFTVPFCFAVGSLISGELGDEWIRRARLWTMTSWTFLTAGIAMGGLWAYEILGWGGYWAWDPVENASFIPWLTATAFIHSVVVQERRGMLKVWNVALIILTYCLTIIGTFLVRSGIIDSVHAFGDTGLTTPLIGFLIAVFLVPLLLLMYRAPLLKPDRPLKHIISREGVFLTNNLVLCTIALVTLVMTLWPAFSKFLVGLEGRKEFGAEAFTLINVPLFLMLLTMTSIGPLLPYGKAEGKAMWRQFRAPLLFAVVIAALNSAFIIGAGLQKTIPSDGTSLEQAVMVVRIGVQHLLPPIIAMIIAGVIQEIVAAALARRRKAGKSLIGNTFAVLLANRRRFGGYICHIGIACVALGIYISSFYEINTAKELRPGEYTLLGSRWAVVYDTPDESLLYRRLMNVRQQQQQLAGIESTLSGMNPDSPETKALFAEYQERARAGQADDTSLRTILNAVETFRRNPEQSVDDLYSSVAANVPSEVAKGKMRAGLELAYKLSKSDASFEHYGAKLRLFRYQPRQLSDEQAEMDWKRFGQLHQKAAAAKDESEMKAALNEIGLLCYEIGPDCLSMLEAIEEKAVRNIAETHRFHDRIRHAYFVREEMETEELLSREASGDAEAKSMLDELGWRAWGGLQSAIESAPANEQSLARTRISALEAQSDFIRPQIKSFYDKRTGQLRRSGEEVKDPEIIKHLSEDVYFILQGIQLGPDGNAEYDRANFRVFVKPGMSIGLLGLLIMIFGAVFALLPRRTTSHFRTLGQE